jgi:two-component system, sensor histidine kinase YesM
VKKQSGYAKRLLQDFSLGRFKSLRVIIAVSFIIAMFAVYSITYYMVSQKFQQVNQTNMENMSKQVAGQVENTVKNYINDIMDVSNYILFQIYMKQNGEEGSMQDILHAVISSREDLDTILLFDGQGNVTSSSRDTSLKNGANITSQQWFLLPRKENQETYFSEPHVQNLYYGSYPWVVTLSRNMGVYNVQKSAVLMMDIRMDELAKKIESVNLGGKGYVYLMDKYGNIIYHPNLQYIHYGLETEDTQFALLSPDGSYLREKGGEQVFTVIQTSMYTGWKIVVVNYVNDIMVPQSEVTGFLVWTILFGLMVIAGMSWIISILVSRPVLKLERSMASVEQGNFDSMVNVRGDREVERLSAAFNKMVTRIKALMGEIVHEQEAKRKSELKALQMQIHPHFLYNTLESVIWMAENGKNKEVVTMVSALSKLFRISLYKGMDSIPVEQELAHVQNYLIIQKMRYRDKINYQIEADEEAKKCMTIKLILQPIVENAIYHGIKDMGEGLIKISAVLVGGMLVFKVYDNGVGMSQETINRIFDKSFVATTGSGVGVKNVHERICLHYGPEYGINIQSEEGAGTLVMLTLPCITEAPV